MVWLWVFRLKINQWSIGVRQDLAFTDKETGRGRLRGTDEWPRRFLLEGKRHNAPDTAPVPGINISVVH
ncbi:hypothetical protein TNCV_3587281 [Trichonephila clavipes]|nr:hypothetical protein TNCV_3587281 [Trichonephila clavipes]